MRSTEDEIRESVKMLKDVTVHPHRFGGMEFRLGKRELGHLHGDQLLDIPFPLKVRNELISRGRVKPHHILPNSGWVSFYLEKPDDVQEAIALLRLSFALATERSHTQEIRS